MTKPVAVFRSGVIRDSRHTVRLDENSQLVLFPTFSRYIRGGGVFVPFFIFFMRLGVCGPPNHFLRKYSFLAPWSASFGARQDGIAEASAASPPVRFLPPLRLGLAFWLP